MTGSRDCPVEQVRCAIYARKSIERGLDVEVNSLRVQYEVCAAYIQSQRHRGWVLAKQYDDAGESGANLARPGLGELLNDVEAGRIDVIVIYKLDRLTRSLTDFVRLLDMFNRFGVSFTSITQAFDTSDSMGRLILNILLTFAQFEREILSDRLKDKFATMRRMGKWIGGAPPFGYDLVDRKLRINDHEADIIRDIYRRYPVARSGNSLLRSLQTQGVRNKQWTTKEGKVRGGKLISRGLFHRIVSHPIYLGVLSYDGQWYEGEHDPIITREQWDAVQSARATKKTNQLPLQPRRHVLLGLLYDPFGRPMRVNAGFNQHRTYRYYVADQAKWGPRKGRKLVRCNAAEVEDLVMIALRSLLLDRSALSNAVSSVGIFDSDIRRACDAGAEAAQRLQHFDLRQTRDVLEALARRIELDWDHFRILLCCHELLRFIAWDGIGRFSPATSAPRSVSNRIHVLRVPAALIRHSRNFSLQLDDWHMNEGSAPNPSLVRLLSEARSAQEIFLRNPDVPIAELAQSSRWGPSFFARLIRLNYLAPDIAAAILGGRQPKGMTRRSLAFCNLPMDWHQQRLLLGFSA